jgi:hypothetical protein
MFAAERILDCFPWWIERRVQYSIRGSALAAQVVRRLRLFVYGHDLPPVGDRRRFRCEQQQYR